MSTRLKEIIKRKERLPIHYRKEKEAHDLVLKFKERTEYANDEFQGFLLMGLFLTILFIVPLIAITNSYGKSFWGTLITIVTSIFLIAFIRRESLKPPKAPNHEQILLADKYSSIIREIELEIQRAEEYEEIKLKKYVEEELSRINRTLEKVENLKKDLSNLSKREKKSLISSLVHLKKMDPYDFEKYVGEIYKKLGYSIITTPKSGDGGVDLILKKGSNSIIVQCKRYSGSVSSSEVRAFLGTMTYHQSAQGKFITTGKFTENCYEFEQRFNIELINGKGVIELARSVFKNSIKFEEIQEKKKEINFRIEAIRQDFLANTINKSAADYYAEINGYVTKLTENRRSSNKFIQPWEIREKVRKIVGPISSTDF